MRIHISPGIPDGELSARMNGCDDGSMFAVIDLGSSTVELDTPEDARRLLEAAARIVGWYEFDGRPHEYLRLTTSTHCAVCGLLKSRHPEPAPVITDSERTCNEVNGGEHCTRGGDHGVHRDSNGDQWRTDGAPGDPHRKRVTDDGHTYSDEAAAAGR